jgi:glycosyltransferase involved in cell wall biosynthesis
VRICMLNDNFYRGSGVTLAIKRVMTSPSFQGIDVYLAGCEKIAGKKSTQEDTSIVSAERYSHFSMMEGDYRLFLALYRFGRWIREMRFDILHVHHRRLAVLANLMTPFTGVPVLFTGHLTFPDAAWFRFFAPRRATAVSPSVVEYLQRCTMAGEIRLIHNPVVFSDLGVIDPATFHRRRVVSVGRLDPVKAHGTLIDAWALLKQRGIHAELDIFGEGSLHASLKAQIVDRGLQHSVTLCGFVPNITERLSCYAFNVLVSQTEGFPNSVVEAAACGLPTLLTDVDGSRDALPGQLVLPNGVPFGDADALSHALAKWLTSPALLQEDGKRFHDYLKSRCSLEIVGERYLDVYLSLLGPRTASVPQGGDSEAFYAGSERDREMAN